MHNHSSRRALFGRTSATLLATVTAGAVFMTSTAAYASDAETPKPSIGASTPVSSHTNDSWDGAAADLSNSEVEELLELLVAIPDDVLARGGEATLAYLGATHPEAGATTKLKVPSVKCIALVGAALAGAMIPASKVVKLAVIAKRYSVKRVANAVLGVRKHMGKKYPNDLRDAALILLGVDEIKEACK